MRVIWTPEAQQDRADIWAHIATDNPRAAARMDELFSVAVAMLADHPRLGRPGQIGGTLEQIPHESYRLVYEIERDTVWALTLVHTARQWPPVRGSCTFGVGAKRPVDKAGKRGQTTFFAF